MNTWIVYYDGSEEEVVADKVIISEAGVLMFFVNVSPASPNLLIRAFHKWDGVELDG